jgi:4-amino-4-deoxychorismate lyase
MCLLFETIRIENGILLNREWHEKRMTESRKEIWGDTKPVNLDEIVRIPVGSETGIIRCKVTYGRSINSVSFQHYRKTTARTFRLIDCGDLDYHLKYSNRHLIEDLFAGRGSCDEIILVKNGFITDTSVSNLIFFDGTRWYTPGKPLLNGTCRRRLLSEGAIEEAEISVSDLRRFRGLKMINALRFSPEEEMIPISGIIR